MRRLTGKETGSALLYVALLWLGAGSSSAAGSCVIDPARVPSWSHAPKLDRSVPFAARYEGCGKIVVFIAAAHTNESRSPTHRLIESVFDRERPQLAVVEGVDARGGINPGGDDPRGLLETARRAAGTMRDSEALLAARLADEADAAVMGGEPTDAGILEVVKARGFRAEDMFGFYVLRFIQQWQRHGKISGPRDDEAIDEEIRGYAPSFARRVRIDVGELSRVSTLRGFKDWYRATNRISFEQGYRAEDAGPSSVASPIRTSNLISDIVGDARERSLISVLAHAVAEYETIVVVYGASHYPVDAPALDAAFGPPRIMGRR